MGNGMTCGDAAQENGLKYDEAMRRLEAIVARVERGEMDIDSLAASVGEAKRLATLCKDKLTRVEAEVREILDDEARD